MKSGDSQSPVRPSALAGVKVVEFTEMAAASFCARLLADAGAEVVKVEPPAGDRYRAHGPFPDGQPDPNWSGNVPLSQRQQEGSGA